ncbi:MFS monocarboxylate transporter-like protein [Phyllosticta capitalensis]|uniref:MFS monocarboxylate transporter-like protein n=1 Tax=Phyllosticta capitalensis TaxID=121624 RepID=A0ABR1YIE6_9PEZI
MTTNDNSTSHLGPRPIEEPPYHGSTSISGGCLYPQSSREAHDAPPKEKGLNSDLNQDKEWRARPSGEDGIDEETQTQPEAPSDQVTYPEGGLRSWLVVVGSFSGMMAGFGLMNSVGIFQAYLANHELSEYDESTIGWIFSLYTFLAFFCGLLIGPFFDVHGPQLLILGGNILLVASMFLLSVCSAFWHFLIVFGVLAGVGTSLIFTPSIGAIAHFFSARRGIATGTAAAGGSIGGIVFPLMLQSLFPKVGFAWACRYLGFLFLFLCIIDQLLIRSRLPPKPGSSIWPDFTILRDKKFALVTLGTFCMEWGLFIPITYIASFALESGGVFTDAFSYQLIAILNAGSSIGRWGPGYIADHVGRYNCQICALLLCLITNLGLWLPASLMAPLDVDDDAGRRAALKGITIVFAFLFGVASGSNISLTPVCVGQLCDTENYGKYYTTCYVIVSFGTLTGIPIAGALIKVVGDRYWAVVVFTAATYAVALASFIGARVIKTGWRLRVKF